MRSPLLVLSVAVPLLSLLLVAPAAAQQCNGNCRNDSDCTAECFCAGEGGDSPSCFGRGQCDSPCDSDADCTGTYCVACIHSDQGQARKRCLGTHRNPTCGQDCGADADCRNAPCLKCIVDGDGAGQCGPGCHAPCRTQADCSWNTDSGCTECSAAGTCEPPNTNLCYANCTSDADCRGTCDTCVSRQCLAACPTDGCFSSCYRHRFQRGCYCRDISCQRDG